MWLRGDLVFVSSHSIAERMRNDRRSIRLEIYSLYREALEDLYLHLSIATSRDMDHRDCRWKMVFNGVNISRALRPHTEVVYGGRRYLFINYDLSSIKHIARDVNELEIEYQGRDTVTIEYTALISTYSVSGRSPGDPVVFTDYTPLVVEEGGVYTFSHQKRFSDKVVLHTVVLPATPHAIIDIGGRVAEARGAEEVSREVDLGEGFSIRVLRGAVVIPIHVVREKVFREPEVSIRDVRVHRESDKYVLRLEIDSTGDIMPREILVVAISRGRNIQVARYSGVPGEALLEISRRAVDREDPRVVLRVVWDWLGQKRYVSREVYLET